MTNTDRSRYALAAFIQRNNISNFRHLAHVRNEQCEKVLNDIFTFATARKEPVKKKHSLFLNELQS